MKYHAKKLTHEPVERPTRSISRDTQLRLQAMFADGVTRAALAEPIPGDEYAAVREAMDHTTVDKRDRAWLRYYAR